MGHPSFVQRVGGGKEVRGLSVIIPSKTDSNLEACLGAIWTHEPAVRSIIVDDGLKSKYGRPPTNDVTIPGVKPFVFARNINLGILAAGNDDVILLNDDALMETQGGFTAMQRLAYEHEDFGLISAACNMVGNINQHPRPSGGMRAEPRMVCFVCALIPRRTIERVGLLDERYVGYGMDDDDYCLRVRKTELKIGIFDGCFVDHSKLKSTYRGMPAADGDFRPNLRLFIQKWGIDNWGHTKESSQFRECFPE